MQELFRKLFNEVKTIHEELAEYINTSGWNHPAFYNDDDDDDVDYTIIITPVLSTELPDNTLSMGNEYFDTIPATESDEVIKSSVEDLVPIPSESEGIPDTMCDVHFVNNLTPLEAKDHFKIVINSNDDIYSSDDDSLYNENIEYVEASPHDSELVSLEISSGSTTTHSEISLSEYDSFIFDLSNDQFPPTDRSDFTHKEFTDELARIISPPEYDCFYFRNLPDRGELISILNSRIRENLSSTTRVNLPVEDDHSPLLSYVAWIFLAYITYPVIPPYLHSFGNKDTIFDPGIAINRFYSFKPVPCVSKPNFVDESSNIFNPPPQPPIYSSEFCGSNAQYGHYCTPQVPFINPEPGYSQEFNFPQDIHDFQQQYLCCDQYGVLLLAWDRVFKIKDAFRNKQYKPEDMQELFRKLFNEVQNIHEELAEYINTPGWNRPAFYNDDDDDDVDYTIAITPVLSTKEPDNSLSMGDEHVDTIPATESDEVIKSSVEDLVLIQSESKGISDTMCDVHFVNNLAPLEAKDHFEIVINSNDDTSSCDDNSLYSENIEYVEASPHDSELVNLEVAEIVIPKDEEIEDDNLREK
nr:hypothetical protein [Tanacetum cinerariifolium]